MRRSAAVGFIVNNTVKAKLFLLHPGDENLMVYEEYPYEAPQPININPESASLWIKLKIIAKTKDWKMDNQFASEWLLYSNL